MRLFLVIFTFVVSSVVPAQVTFEAKVSKKRLGVNERLRVDFVMNKDGDNFKAPSFEGFKASAGPQSINNSWVNGVRSFSKSYSFFLTPTKKGKFTIGQASIEIDGNTYKTIAIPIDVTTAVDKPKDPNDPNYIFSENVHLIAEVSNTKPYLNEAITVIYKLYVGDDLGVRDLRTLDKPRFNDFWSQDIEIKQLEFERGAYQGENYRYITVQKSVLYPQKSGKLDLEPLSLDLVVDIPTNKRDIFGRRQMSYVSKTVTSKRRTINVKALPDQGKPDSFSGAVGTFDFEVKADKSSLKATEAFSLSLSVSGKGNLKLFKIPKPILPSALEVYEPEHSEKVRTRLSGMRGTVSDAYTVVPNYQGNYPIPSISFSYFDPNKKQYRTINSDELVVKVNEGPTLNSESTADSKSIAKSVVTGPGNTFASFKTSTQLRPINQTPFFGSQLFWVLFLGPLLSIPLIILFKERRNTRKLDIAGNRIRRTNKLARKYLSDAKKSLNNKERFYNALERALHNYLKSKLQIETSELNKDLIRNLLTTKGSEQATQNAFLELLTSCELARYTPLSSVDMKNDYNKAANTISQLDKQLN